MSSSLIRGMTLTELLVALPFVGVFSVISVSLLSVSFQIEAEGAAEVEIQREGVVIMDRITERLSRCTYLLIPNAHNTSRDLLAFGGMVNDDNDLYFGDPLFPRIDEDMGSDMTADGKAGLAGIDDDGDGQIDESVSGDDDEFWLVSNEDPLDGEDNDNDGAIDEDLGGDQNKDGAPGIAGMDDDGDGSIDEGDVLDDDEDGFLGEHGLIATIFKFDAETTTLTEEVPFLGEVTVLSSRVIGFKTVFLSPEKVAITLQLSGDGGELVELREYVYVRNTYQRTGKRVK